MDSLPVEFVVTLESAQRHHQPVAETCAADWNAVHAAIGSFADEHTTL